MRGNYRATAAVGRSRRLTLLIICAFLLTTIKSISPPTLARSDTAVPEATIFSQNFNGASPPSLPAGWTTSRTGAGTIFTTVASDTSNPTPSTFTWNPSMAGSSEIVSPAIELDGSPTRLVFRHQIITEPTPGYDGGVLEISIAGGPFQDIVAAGGSFVQGAYSQTIGLDATGNPLIGRPAWTGAINGYINTVVNLPSVAAGQFIQLRWVFGSDNIVAGQGWWIDDVQLINSATTTGIVYTFTNSTPINMPNGVATSPYPSTINVSNIPIQLAKITVSLNSFNHTFASDVDILLVGPQGQTSVLMSDVGGGTDLISTTITLDDDATVPLPTTTIVTGTYRPTNAGLADTFPAPAPAQAGGSVLSVFSGTNPNGEWRLFAVDDVNTIDPGFITGGWTLTITPAISGQNTGPIAITDSGTGSPYPSDISITNHPNLVSRVLVNLTNFNHTSPDDVDILLVSPSGRSVVLMSDVGGSNPITNANLSIEDTAPGAMPDAGQISSGRYRPTDFEPNDTFPPPAPGGGPTGRTLSSLNGTNANGTWSLYVVDDAGNNAGSISGGWNILVGTTAGVITVQGSGNTASTYPAEFNVSGLPGNTTKVVVRVDNFSHVSPDDVDILLVGPDNRRIVLMSDAGGTNEVGGLNLMFDDAAATAIPDSAPITSGTYKPADYEPGEAFPAPAPQGPPTGNTLNAFYGGAPNGVWRLYVVNDGGGYGSIAGSWSLTLQTSTSACLVTVSPTVQSFPVAGGNGSFNITQPTGCGWTASTTDSFIAITSGTSGGGNGAITYTVAANTGPARTGSIEVTNGVTSRSFQVQQASGCPLAVSQSTMNFRGAGGSGSFSVSAGGGCSWQGSTLASWIQITSQPQTGDGTLVFNVLPNPARTPRSGTITIGNYTVTVNQAPTRATPFDFDGDSRTDISIYRPSTGTWWISNSGGSTIAQPFGLAEDRVVPADYDGDNKADISVYRSGTWYVLKSSDGSVSINNWGTATDVPVPSDYNSDGSAELAVYRPSTGEWWILNSDGTFSSTAFGLPTDIPTPGDYDGDGKTDLSVYRPATMAGDQGSWWILNTSDAAVVRHFFGIAGDVPVPADFDGDGRDNVALYRASNGTWYRSTDASRNYDAVQWGISGDKLAAGDYDGDGKAEPAVVRFAGSAVWHILRSTSGPQSVQFGIDGDRAVPNAYSP